MAKKNPVGPEKYSPEWFALREQYHQRVRDITSQVHTGAREFEPLPFGEGMFEPIPKDKLSTQFKE